MGGIVGVPLAVRRSAAAMIPGAGVWPTGPRIGAAALAAFLLAFAATGPWSIAGVEIARLAAPIAVAAAIAAVALAIRRDWRMRAIDALGNAEPAISAAALVAASAVAALVLARVVFSRYGALAVNAWDFSVADRAVAETLRGNLLFSDIFDRSYLGIHASYVLLAFVPLYALWATPFWMLLAQAIAIAAGAALCFLTVRFLLRDDLAAALVAAGFLLNDFTARAVQYPFHVEIFYPAAVFGLIAAFLYRRPVAYALALALLLSIKEDAVLITSGFALWAWLAMRRPRWAAVAGGAGLLVFALDWFLVLPSFSHAQGVSYAGYWSSFGATPLKAAAGMVAHPLLFCQALSRSGIRHLFEPLLFLPLGAPAWALSYLPALLPFGASDSKLLSHFRLYYSMPVLPLLVVGAADGLRRLTAWLSTKWPTRSGRFLLRCGALILLLACALDGAGYSFQRERPERRELDSLLRSADGRKVRIQGALLPHAGYGRERQALRSTRDLPGAEAVLLDLQADPYPFAGPELRSFGARLRASGRYSVVRSPSGLRLFVPLPRSADTSPRAP